MVRLRLISMSLAALICLSIVYLAVTQRFSAVTDIFTDEEAVKVEIEEKEKPPPPPPPPNRPPPPPPPEMRVPPPIVEAPPVITEVPVAVDPPPSPPSVITNPTWLERPDGRQYSEHYPERALEREREGRVVLDCVVDSGGRLACSVASEEPSGWGFGNAAIRISRYFRMAPMTVDGRPTDGGRVRVPIAFRLG